jgi:hypothetical protein
MIARYYILLPFDLFITEDEAWSTIELTSEGLRLRVYPPLLTAVRLNPTDTVMAQANVLKTLSPPTFTENVRVGGKKVAQVNVLTIDFIKSEFDRSDDAPLDPKPELAFEIANDVLGRIRVFSRAFQIKPLAVMNDPWRLSYLTDDLREFEMEQGKRRGKGAFASTVGVPALSPEIIMTVASSWGKTSEPYVWDELLLDAHASLPDIGSATVMAYAALETFIGWALQVLQRDRPLPEGLWDWINKRDHWSKEPSVAEQFDALLRTFTGRSLKEESGLWQGFTQLRKARIAVAHEGVAVASAGEAVDASKAKELVNQADSIIAWVENLLPVEHRRLRRAATGPFARKMATPEESAALGLAYIKSGELGVLPPGGDGVTFGFLAKPESDSVAASDEKEAPPPDGPS